MSISDIIILVWLLPSLVTFELIVAGNRLHGDHLEDYDQAEWTGLLVASILWPIGVCVLILECLKPLFTILIKERSFKEDTNA